MEITALTGAGMLPGLASNPASSTSQPRGTSAPRSLGFSSVKWDGSAFGVVLIKWLASGVALGRGLIGVIRELVSLPAVPQATRIPSTRSVCHDVE